MGTRKKEFDERKTTVGVSLTNNTLKELDVFCNEYGLSRSTVMNRLLDYYLMREYGLDDLFTILDNGVLKYAEY